MCNTRVIWIGRMLLMCLAASVLVPILQWAFHAEISWHALVTCYLQSVAYALCIGTALTMLLMKTWIPVQHLRAAVRWMVYGAIIVGGTAVGCLAAGLILWAVFGPHYEYWDDFKGSFKIGVMISVFCVGFVTTYERYKAQLRVTEMQLKAKELERERALKLATEARLSSLESRIHPHFLFNTINSVSSLIHDEPLRAERMLNQMADLLRFSLDSGQRGLVALERELRVIEDYLEIEKARFGDRLQYEIQVPEALLDAAVPPLSLQTLVENSVKYAVSSRRRGAGIKVSAITEDGRLSLKVSDDGPGFPNAELPAGHGLNNLQERLVALFGPEGNLSVAGSESGAAATIEIPLTSESEANRRSSAERWNAPSRV